VVLDLINRFAKGKSGAGPDDPDPPKEFIQHLANDLESLKEFVQHLAFDIDGLEAHNPDEEVDINGAKGTVVQYWKNFTAGWQIENEPISPKLIRQVRLVCPSYIV
jgi:hypothetical protein